MDNQIAPIDKVVSPSDRREQEAKQTVKAVLDQVPGLLRVKQVRRKDGQVVDFSPALIGQAFETALKRSGIDDSVLLARMTYQALARLDRQFGEGGIPGTEEINRLVAVILIDNNLSQAAKFLLTPEDRRPAGSRFGGSGLRFHRRFTRLGTHPYDEVKWEIRDAVITDGKGQPVFEQRGVEIPKAWSQGAANIVVSKYFRGGLGKPERESSVRQMVDRVAQTMSRWGAEDGYFATDRTPDL